MDMEDKFLLCEAYRRIMTMARLDGNRQLIADLEDLDLDKVFEMESEHEFFKCLHQQSELDNVLSLLKIFKRLEVDIPNVKIKLTNIGKTYDELWNSINEQIPISNATRDILFSIMEDIVYDDELDHPNTKRNLLRIWGRLSDEAFVDYEYVDITNQTTDNRYPTITYDVYDYSYGGN